MKENNPCIVSDCLGNCCKNLYIELTITERKKIFPNAIKVGTMRELKKVPIDYPDVYYTPVRRKKFQKERMVEAHIVGRCPNLKFDGNCQIYEDRSYAARNIKIGSKFCNEIRVDYGLPIMIPKEPVE